MKKYRLRLPALVTKTLEIYLFFVSAINVFVYNLNYCAMQQKFNCMNCERNYTY